MGGRRGPRPKLHYWVGAWGGAVCGEVRTGGGAGRGARWLGGSDYGQTGEIWSALCAAAILAACLGGVLGLVERTVLKRMGMAQ